MPTPSLEHLAKSHRAQSETLANLMRSALRSAEELTDLHIAVARDCLRAAAEHNKAATTFPDLASLTAFGAQTAERGAARWNEYLRGIQGIMARLHEESTTTLRTHCDVLAESATVAARNAAEHVPGGGEVLTTAIRSVLQASRKSLDDAGSLARQLATIAHTNRMAASAAKAARPTAKAR